MKPFSGPSTKKIQLAALAVMVAGTIALSFVAHEKAGYTVPNPWNDESWVLWKSVAFMESNTLFTAQLNPETTVYTFPGYEVLMGTMFKVTGFSLGKARWSTWVFMMLAYMGMVWLLSRYPYALLSALLTSWLASDEINVALGNVARPEAALCVLLIAGFLLLQRGHLWEGLAVLFLGGTLHPNAIYFALPATVWAAVQWRFRPPRPSTAALVVVIICGLLCLAYAAFCVWNWRDFTISLSSGMDLKYSKNTPVYLLMSPPGVTAMIFFGLLVLNGWRRLGIGLPLLFGFSCEITFLLGHEMWYHGYHMLALLILGFALIQFVDYASRLVASCINRPLARAIAPQVITVIAFLWYLHLNYRHGFLPGPRNYLNEISWGWGMHVEDKTPYVTQQDVQRVTDEVMNRVGERSDTRVFFLPEGDGLFFHDALRGHCVIYQPIRTDILPDFAVIRLSKYFPPWWMEHYLQPKWERYAVSDHDLVYERDGTERWFIKRIGTNTP